MGAGAVTRDAETSRVESLVRGYLLRRFPALPAEVPLTVRPVATHGRHRMLVVQTDAAPAPRMFIKGPRRAQPGREAEEALLANAIQTEHAVLTEIAPKIRAASPLLRCAEVLAYDPERKLLLLEMVEGEPLQAVLFGLGRGGRRRLTDLLGRCGEWLARFHQLTRTGEEGNPFDWLVEEFDREANREVFHRHAGGDTHRALRGLAERLRRRYSGLRRPLSRVHGEFAPYHILVSGEAIYILDFEGSRPGFPHEDLAYFIASYDVALPWRRLVGGWRLGLDRQRDLFLRAYWEHAGAFSEPDHVVMRLARVLALAKLRRFLGPKDPGARSPRLLAIRAWRSHRLRVVARREIEALGGAAQGPFAPGSPTRSD